MYTPSICSIPLTKKKPLQTRSQFENRWQKIQPRFGQWNCYLFHSPKTGAPHGISPFSLPSRAQMVKAGLIPKVVELLKRPPYRARGLRLLYHMSIDDRCKAMFAYTDVGAALPLILPAPAGVRCRVILISIQRYSTPLHMRTLKRSRSSPPASTSCLPTAAISR